MCSDDEQISVFVRGARENPALILALQPIRAKKAVIAALTGDLNARQMEVSRMSADQTRVRENMKSLKGTAEEQALIKRYATQLNQQEDRLEVLRKELSDLEQRRQQAQGELATLLKSLSLDIDVSKP
jgi:predicted nuclease with TOPRIM domain